MRHRTDDVEEQPLSPSPARVSRLLDELGGRCDEITKEVGALPRPQAKRVIGLTQRLAHARGLMRLRLLALRRGPVPTESRVHRSLWRSWLQLLSDSVALERAVRATD